VRTFIVRIREAGVGGERGGATTPRLRGVVDEVATGLRATFRDGQELINALMTAAAGERNAPAEDEADRAGFESGED
jgi:hypothetical protein